MENVANLTPENFPARVAQLKSREELLALWEALDNARNVDFGGPGADNFRQRRIITEMLDHLAVINTQWLENARAFASACAAYGWYNNPDLVPAINYTGQSNDPSQYRANLIAHYGGFSKDNLIDRLGSRDPMVLQQTLQTIYPDQDVSVHVIPVAQAAAEAQAKAKREAEAAAAAAAAAAAQHAAVTQNASQIIAAANANPTAQNVAAADQAVGAVQNSEMNLTLAQQQAAAAQTASSSAGNKPSLLTVAGVLATLWSFIR